MQKQLNQKEVNPSPVEYLIRKKKPLTNDEIINNRTMAYPRFGIIALQTRPFRMQSRRNYYQY